MDIKNVTLYRNGVGLFDGILDKTEFVIKVKDMNNFLKTIKTDGNISYDSSKKIVGGDGIQVDFDNPLFSVMKVLVGHTITVKTEREYTGKVLGIRTETIQCDEGGCKKNEHHLMLMKASTGDLYDIKVSEIRSYDIEDIAMIKKIDNFLIRRNFARSDSDVKIMVDTGDLKPPFRVRYATNVAMWKVIYELNVKSEELILHAVVDNDSSHDWESVQLKLMSEAPYNVKVDLFSIMKLEESREVELRPHAKRRMYSMSKAPEVMAESFEMEEGGGEGKLPGFRFGKQNVEMHEVGLVKGSFRQFSTKVSVMADKSAKVFLGKFPVKVKNWIWFDPDEMKLNPDMAVSVVSTDGFSMNGPITVYNDGVYLGESDVKYIKGSPSKVNPSLNFIRYAREMQCEITKSTPVEDELIVVRKTSFDSSSLMLKLRLFRMKKTLYNIRYMRESVVMIRLIHRLQYGYTHLDQGARICGTLVVTDKCGGSIFMTKHEDAKAETIEINRTGNKCRVDMLVPKGKSTIIKTEFYYEDRIIDLNNRLRLIGFINMDLMFDSIRNNIKSFALQVNMLKQLEEKKRRLRSVNDAILKQGVSMDQTRIMRDEKNTLDSEVEIIEKKILRNKIVLSTLINKSGEEKMNNKVDYLLNVPRHAKDKKDIRQRRKK